MKRKLAEEESATFLILNTDFVVNFILMINLYRQIYRQNDGIKLEKAGFVWINERGKNVYESIDYGRYWIMLDKKMVGTTGFEPVTTTPPVWCATRLRYAPKMD